MDCILPILYWPPIQYFTKWFAYNKIFLEHNENYPKQTYRNRCMLYGANGVQSIQIPVLRGSLHKTLYAELEISYETPWINNHLRTIESAYKSTPFYEYYIDYIIALYMAKPQKLIDLNLSILQLCQKWMKLELKSELTKEYTTSFEGEDYRMSIHPKENKSGNDALFIPQNYIQGFESRHGFIPNLSILDLIFNTGPEARTILAKSTLNSH